MRRGRPWIRVLRLAAPALARKLLPARASATERARIGPFVYVRFHGSGVKYGGAYPEQRLRGWAEWLTAQRDAGCDVYAYFNHDTGGHAPRDATALRRLLEA